MTEFESSAFKDYRHISLRWNKGGFFDRRREHRL